MSRAACICFCHIYFTLFVVCSQYNINYNVNLKSRLNMNDNDPGFMPRSLNQWYNRVYPHLITNRYRDRCNYKTRGPKSFYQDPFAFGTKINYKNAAVINGKTVDIHSFPNMAALFNMASMCGATILSTRILLTAAHCFYANKDPVVMAVVVGTTKMYKPELIDYLSPEVRYDVCAVKIHENYSAKTFRNDIALVLTDRALLLGPSVQKAKLPTNDLFLHDYRKNKFSTAGWGWTSYPVGDVSDELQTISLSLVKKSDCERMHNNMKFTDDMMCLYTFHKDTCRGDSGGGVLHDGIVVGIVSHGDGCATVGKPGIYTNVYYFLGWIRKAVLTLSNIQCSYDVI